MGFSAFQFKGASTFRVLSVENVWFWSFLRWWGPAPRAGSLPESLRMGNTFRKKAMVENKGEINGAQYKNCSVPENRAASISSDETIANAIFFSTVFERLDRSRHRHRSRQRWKNNFWFQRKINANPKKIVRAPKTAMRRFSKANSTQMLRNFRPFSTTSIDRPMNWTTRKRAGWLGWLGTMWN